MGEAGGGYQYPDSPEDWASLGSVLDADGNKVEVYGRNGAVLLEHTMGSLEIEAGWLTALRELLDRAAMPGQQEAATAAGGPGRD